jgi:hypothetical protein
MPYRIKPVKKGFVVVGPNGPMSHHPLPLAHARAQLRALYAAEDRPRPRPRTPK